MLVFPLCCYADADDPLEIQLYAAYNRGGDPATAGLNYQGRECPAWSDLPENVRAKWRAVADFSMNRNQLLRSAAAGGSGGPYSPWTP